MILTILPYIFIALAAICNAVMDRLENSPAFYKSIFRYKNAKWWVKDVSWQHTNFIKFTKYRPDGWHIAKSLMVVFIITAICFGSNHHWWEWFIMATVWNVTFNLFYNKILKA